MWFLFQEKEGGGRGVFPRLPEDVAPYAFLFPLSPLWHHMHFETVIVVYFKGFSGSSHYRELIFKSGFKSGFILQVQLQLQHELRVNRH